jgi:hypothetical protein
MVIGVTRAIDDAMSPLISSGGNQIAREKMQLAQSAREHGLWPATVLMRDFSIEQTLQRMETFQEVARTPEGVKVCVCRESTFDLAGKFWAIRQRLLDEQRPGICLDCVVSRGKTAEKGECRLGDCR